MEAESYARVVEKISFSPKRFPTVPFRGMREREKERMGEAGRMALLRRAQLREGKTK